MENTNKAYRQVLDYFIDKIKNGEIKKGSKINTERELAESLGVSREAIREAMRILEIIGLIEKRPRLGSYIKEEIDEWIMEPVTIIFKLSNVGAKEVYEFRRMIEVKIASLAAKRITEEEIKELTVAYNKMIDKGTGIESALYDKKFHHIIAKASKNRIIINAYNAMSPMMDLFTIDIRSIVESNEADTIIEDMHKNIFRSIVNRDEEGARLSMEDHMRIVNKHIEKLNQYSKNKFESHV